MEKILVIAAHPDDEVLGLGGTIAKHTNNGDEVNLLIVTDGSTSQYRDNPDLDKIIAAKKEETRNCADILGIKEIIYGNLPDMRLDSVDHVIINKCIEDVVDNLKPSIVYTHFCGDLNMDHQRVSESTLVACRPTSDQYTKKVFMYSTPSSTEWNVPPVKTVFQPNWYVDINGIYAEKKYEAFSCYRTETREYPHPRSIEYLKSADTAEGNKVGLLSAESFVLVRGING